MFRVLLFLSLLSVTFADWPQGSGPYMNYVFDADSPRAFSASINKGIKWRVPLPETGQSSPVIVGDKIFLTCFKPVSENTKEGKDLLAMCFSVISGELLWQRDMPGDAVSKISGCFGDNSGPAAVSDGQSVCFFNASGLINKYDLEGNLIWSKNIKNSRRADPFLLEGALIITGSAELKEIKGRHIKALDFETGEILWESASHSWDGLTLVPYKRPNGEWVGLIARGGGHVEAQYTDGYELISLKTGKSFWQTEFKGFRSTQNFTLKDDKAYIFLPNGIHQVISLETGKIVREDNILTGSMLADYNGQEYTYREFDDQIDLKKRTITQMSNLIVGNYHFFRTYNDNYLGRINIKTGKAEFIELPTQIERSSEGVKYCWIPTEEGKKYLSKNKKKKPQLANLWLLKANDMINKNGYVVFGDDRSQYSGWGHVTAALPTAVGDKLYVPTMSGLVYVLKWNAEKLNGAALLSISDLGRLGESWSRSSISFAKGMLFGRTIKELICISGCDPKELD